MCDFVNKERNYRFLCGNYGEEHREMAIIELLIKNTIDFILDA